MLTLGTVVGGAIIIEGKPNWAHSTKQATLYIQVVKN